AGRGTPPRSGGGRRRAAGGWTRRCCAPWRGNARPAWQARSARWLSRAWPDTSTIPQPVRSPGAVPAKDRMIFRRRPAPSPPRARWAWGYDGSIRARDDAGAPPSGGASLSFLGKTCNPWENATYRAPAGTASRKAGERHVVPADQPNHLRRGGP